MGLQAFDIEVYPNLFTLTAKQVGNDAKDSYRQFVIHESRNDITELLSWLGERNTLVGFNSINYDAQVVEFIWQKGGKVDTSEIYEFSNNLINLDKIEDLPYSEWNLSFKHIDLYKINHYDNKRVSLKWLEFSTRHGRIEDLPIAPHLEVPKSGIDKVLRYNKNDVDVTESFYHKCLTQIQLREELVKRYSEPRIINMSDSSLGAYIFEHILTKEYGMKKSDLKKGSRYTTINVKDCLVDYVSFNAPELKEVHEHFKNLVIEDVDTKGIKGEKYGYATMFQDMVFVYGSGGVHACYAAGEYKSDEEYVIYSVDVSSYYPNLAITNRFYPKHIGKTFCDIYHSVYKERQTYPKGSALNYAFKIGLNSVYGKSNSVYSIFYDPAYTLKITVNGQLLLTMLAEGLADVGRLLMVNTDGVEVLIPRSKVTELESICAEWENLTGLTLEFNTYDKLVIRDVNNYMAIDAKGKPKRKGAFEIYYDYTEEDGKPHQYHKSPNATIIPEALFKYYMNDIPVEETINMCNNILEFCYGIKKQKGFEHWLISADPNGVIDIEKNDDKVLRYFISKNGANIYKFWMDGRKNNLVGVNRGQLVKVAQNIRNSEIETVKKGTKGSPSTLVRLHDVDKEFYIRQCYELIDLINSNARDNAYVKYMKGERIVEEDTNE